MTWSILAHDPAGGEFGICVATKGFAVGGVVPYGHGQNGILATQAMPNPMFGGRGLKLLADDYPADKVLAMLLLSDDGREMRQLHVMDQAGRIAQHTGSGCVAWCGSVCGTNVSVAGNMLAGPEVVEATRDSYLSSTGTPFPERLMNAMEAGEAAGGDKRGKQSASLRVWKGEEYTFLDIRTDNSADPLKELRRLYLIAHERYFQMQLAFPTRRNPSGIF